MKVAVPTDSGEVSQHFGRCPEFTIANIEGDEVTEKKIIENPGHKPGYIPEFLKEKGVDCVITGGIGRKAIALFEKYDIMLFTGLEGKIEEVIENFISGELTRGENPCSPGKGKNYGVGREDKHHDH